MIEIVIAEETSDESEMAELLRHIAKMIDEGYTSGAYPTWEITDNEEADLEKNRDSGGGGDDEE